MDAAEIAAREAGLRKPLSRAQLVMIGLGGAIGTYAEIYLRVANLVDCRRPLARAPQRGVLRRQARTGARYNCG